SVSLDNLYSETPVETTGARKNAKRSQKIPAPKKYEVAGVSKKPWKYATVPHARVTKNRAICKRFSTTWIGLKRNARSKPSTAGIKKNMTNIWILRFRFIR